MAGSRATATGTLDNLGDEHCRLLGAGRLRPPGTDNADRTGRVDLDDVAPGASVEFDVERQVDLDDVDCIVLEVNGPLPFGLALD